MNYGKSGRGIYYQQVVKISSDVKLVMQYQFFAILCRDIVMYLPLAPDVVAAVLPYIHLAVLLLCHWHCDIAMCLYHTLLWYCHVSLAYTPVILPCVLVILLWYCHMSLPFTPVILMFVFTIHSCDIAMCPCYTLLWYCHVSLLYTPMILPCVFTIHSCHIAMCPCHTPVILPYVLAILLWYCLVS